MKFLNGQKLALFCAFLLVSGNYYAQAQVHPPVSNECLKDPLGDCDGDGIPNQYDIDNDNDGVPDYIENETGSHADLITNGDFEQGNIGFQSDYTYASHGSYELSNEGYYWVGSYNEYNSDWHSTTIPKTDYSEGTAVGKYMIINGASVADTDIWRTTITVEPNTFYVFDMAMANVDSWEGLSGGGSADPHFQLKINSDIVVNDKELSYKTAGKWERVFGYWYSGEATSATLSVRNLFTATNGNDLALDLIGFFAAPDTDGDGIINALDLDTDGDGCSDAFESGATTATTALYQFGANVGTNGLFNNLETPIQVTYLANWQPASETIIDSGVLNYTPTYAKALDNTIKECPNSVSTCTKPGITGTPLNSQVGISTLQAQTKDWPTTIPNGSITLESKTKGFVISRVSSPSNIEHPQEGMLIYDTTAHCVKLYNGTTWSCIQQNCNL